MNKEGLHDQAEEQDKLHRQVERASLFTHTSLTGLAARVNESESFLYALIDLMIQKGVIAPEEVIEIVQQVRKELIEKQEVAHPGLAMRVDGDEGGEHTPVNCEERWHVCNAICCKLDFALNAEEVESGRIKWDMGRPYYIRHEENCFCAHLNLKTKQCGIYQNRPGICKKYSCAKDIRIWKDFEKMELNYDFINTHLREAKPKLIDSPMFTDQKIVYKNEL
ncbi:MAG TPA: YkgJ family cysteine cluster protein [Candidatus Methanoperedens sp.]|nr:YkgJ family cysteine cluster protein [Candidatus Methanoperedens sp.]HLB71711.1 YkgJ family cysteine cluster protein [Candidatus Methanoperedens sp.]